MKRFILLCTLIGVTTAATFAGPTITTSDGSKVELFDVSSGTNHEFDSRTLTEKAYLKLPESVRKLAPMKITGGLATLKSHENSIAMGLRSKAFPRLSPKIELYISDDTGWYIPNGNRVFTQNLAALQFKHPAQAQKTLMVSLYDTFGSVRKPSPPVATVKIGNPHYDKSLAGHVTATKPTTATAGALQMNIHNFITGIQYSRPTEYGYELGSILDAAPAAVTTNLINGLARPSRMPQTPWTLLAFDVMSSGTPVEKLGLVGIEMENPKGAQFKDLLASILHRQGGSYALLWPDNIPTTDGNWKFIIRMTEPPAPNSTAWKNSPPILLDTDTTGTTGLVGLDTFSVECATTDSPGQLTTVLNNYDPAIQLDSLAIQVRDTATSAPIPFSLKCEFADLSDPQKGVIDLQQTTGSVVVSIAKGTLRSFSFTGLPQRAK